MSASDYESYESGDKDFGDYIPEIYKTNFYLLNKNKLKKSSENYFNSVDLSIGSQPLLECSDYFLIRYDFRDIHIICELTRQFGHAVLFVFARYQDKEFLGIGYYDRDHEPVPEEYIAYLNTLKEREINHVIR